MEIGPVNRADLSVPLASPTTSLDWTTNDRQIVSAVQWLKQAEWLGQERELTYLRDPKTGHFIIKILDRQTGDVIDQIPPETILRLVTELQAELKPKVQ